MVHALPGNNVLAVPTDQLVSASKLLLRLEELGWRTVAARPVDLFPHTPHTECVFTLEPR